jgi:hypothetical protein
VHSGLPIRAVAGCFALAAFAIALISGLAADRPTDDILIGALGAMFACHLLGLMAAHAAGIALREQLTLHRNDREARISRINHTDDALAGTGGSGAPGA